MFERTVSGITLTLLLIGMLTLAFNIQPVEASGTIYIRADGSVDPDTAPISTVDNITYTFTDNIYDEIVVERDNIVVDGVGYTLQGTGSGIGINLTARSNVTIENMEITAFTYGIFLLFSSNNTVSGNNITKNDEYGIGLFDYSRYNIISENNITDNWCGIWLCSNYNVISGNNITGNNDHGVHLWCVSNNTVSGNNITANKKSGIYLYRSSDNIISENNITNNILGIWLFDASNNSISGNNITNNILGIFFMRSSDNTISGNNITENNADGIVLDYSKFNIISGNSITENNEYGIWLFSSSDNIIQRNNVTANNEWGICLQQYSNFNSISGNKITNNEYGIILIDSSNNIISGNKITNNEYGIWLVGSSGNIISGNNVTNNILGIWLDWSSNNIISGNKITNNEYGIYLYHSSNSTLRNNDASNNKYNFDVYGYYYVQDIDDSNTVDGKPVYYWINRRDMAVPLDAGYVALINCTSITVKNLNLTNNGQGVLMVSTTNSTITKNNITNNWYGIRLVGSSNNIISGNSITENNEYGIWLYESSNNALFGNNITENNDEGISLLFHSNFNSISGNKITNNGYGIWLFDSSNNSISGNKITNNGYGIILIDSSNNSISGNKITNNWYGIGLYESSNNALFGNNITENNDEGIVLLDYSKFNIISGNKITNNGCGIGLSGSSNNIIYHNNFVDNTEQVRSYELTNVWDDGYPSGGNYWSDHVCTGNPSDGTQPYIVDENNIDYYPFQDPNGWLLPPPPPGYTLTIYSAPTEVTFTADGISHTTPWSRTYGEDASVSLIMPEIYTVGDARYYWNQWSDGNTSRSRTVTMNTNITLTAHYAGPYYQLTVTSSPITGITFTINGEPETTPYTAWLLLGSHTLIMPETHDGYVWSHWLEDGDPKRTKTITLQGTTWTGVFAFAVEPYGPEAEFEAIPDTALTGESIKFDASASLAGWNGTHEMLITEYRWDFGDGNQTTTFTPTVYHSFSSSGIYYVTLAVYAPGATPETDSTTKKVTITAIPVGGYSFPIKGYTAEKPLTLYLVLIAILAASFTTIRRKIHK